MPVRIKLPAKAGASHNFHPQLRSILQYGFLSAGILFLILAFVVSFYYNKYARLTDEKLLAGPFPNSSSLYAAPPVVAVGDLGAPGQVAARLSESGYTENARNSLAGWYHLRADAIEIFPGSRSFSGLEPGVLKFKDNKISSIISLRDNAPRTQYTLEPKLLSSLYDKNREKRRLVKYDDIPPVLVHAVVSIEDKRFFQHSGFDPMRILKAVLVNIKERRNAQGASTITQQLARNIWLDRRKTFTRKFDELLITLHLERKLTKQKIFEYYANQVDLGHRGTFAIRGFGEAAQAYFGKDIRSLTLPEAATLAGIIQAPGMRNPVSYPKRAEERRNVVLKQMLDNGYISAGQYQTAVKTPLVTARQGIEAADAPYFVDLVNDRLINDFQDRDFQESGSRIYTTLDLDLQRDAAEAVALGMREINSILTKRSKTTGETVGEPQIALICLDPHTGEVKALIGGRNYGVSQLDHVIAKRPSGSVFKPFVYAAALNTGLWKKSDPMTPSTIVKDEARTFYYAGKAYEPTDYHNKGVWLGDVTLRRALAKSLNVPTVEVAELVGYGAVADLAHKAGLEDIRATPAMALGAYDVTPLEMAGAYTMFANNGVMVKPRFISEIVNRSGADVWSSQPETKKILDGRVNFLVVNMMQEVLRSGTGAGVWARGFRLPAAGKTGTEHDAWFAGFTTKLLCVVWIGMDNYQDLKMEGAKAALPIWTEFMKQAHKHRAYRDVGQFNVPDGIVSAQIDSDTGQLATSACPPGQTRTEYYLLGTQPVAFCPLHTGGSTEIAGWDTSSPNRPMSLPNIPSQPGILGASADSPDLNPRTQGADQSKQKKGLFEKLKGIFK
ncbi:MAG: PBP1A family penicillin-binding protein [Acidobacteriaceae bacterium]|nr:PBP1A family penicillin-binding protein [Acidobacteriaceae bacterium]MBV9224777.1 PBP1A family penicillin-binding protein [Acidobacteriaceae bacterium]MBV9307619.1 PBP1A family penicillin-binding protein [Acidobacteriaceae bacterium]MBV9678579.1 PBP1A family penicillin-binding protein [Acidobacteriaceae bacterium]MBV9940447.1 PBP1A family penicillin-binding protein [Acidobacteriaceae bacterium]